MGDTRSDRQFHHSELPNTVSVRSEIITNNRNYKKTVLKSVSCTPKFAGSNGFCDGSWMRNSMKGVGGGLTVPFRVSIAFLAKLERERGDPGGAKNKNPPVGDHVCKHRSLLRSWSDCPITLHCNYSGFRSKPNLFRAAHLYT